MKQLFLYAEKYIVIYLKSLFMLDMFLFFNNENIMLIKVFLREIKFLQIVLKFRLLYKII